MIQHEPELFLPKGVTYLLSQSPSCGPATWTRCEVRGWCEAEVKRSHDATHEKHIGNRLFHTHDNVVESVWKSLQRNGQRDYEELS